MYSSFSDFMLRALKAALPEIKDNRQIPDDVIIITCELLVRGWVIFAAVCTILTLGAVAFVLAIAAFFDTPAGIVVAIVLAAAGYGAYRGIKYLYQYRFLPLAVWAVGKLVKNDYDNNSTNESYISDLFRKVVRMIIDKVKAS